MVVFANSKSEWSSLPRGAADLRSQGGRTIPMVFVTSSDGTTGIQAIPYESLKSDIRKAERELRKKLEEAEIADEEGDAGEATREELLALSQAWSNADGKTVTAAVAAVSGDSVTFVMPDGSRVEYPLAKLSADSRERLSKLVATP